MNSRSMSEKELLVALTQFILFVQQRDIWFCLRTYSDDLKVMEAERIFDLRDRFIEAMFDTPKGGFTLSPGGQKWLREFKERIEQLKEKGKET